MKEELGWIFREAMLQNQSQDKDSDHNYNDYFKVVNGIEQAEQK